MDLKRTILAVALSMAVLLLFQMYLAPPPPQGPGAPPPAASPVEPGVAPPAPWVTGAPAGEVPATPAVPVRHAVLENDRVTLRLSSRSAAIVEARLKEYRETPAPESPDVRLLAAPAGTDLAGAVRLLEAIPEWNQVYEEVEHRPDRVTYSWTSPAGIRIEKTYSLAPGRYDVDVDVRLRNGAGAALRDRLGLLLVQDFAPLEDSYSFTGPAYYRGGDFEEVKIKRIRDGVQAPANISWAALLEKYFLVAAVPSSPEGTSLRIGSHLGQDKVAEVELLGPVFDLYPGAEATFSYSIYLGPKLPAALAPLGANLDHVAHYGFFHVIAKPLMVFLNAIYGVTGNYGIAIIILTTVIKAVFWPLSARSFKSMQRMKDLQPKMQRLKEKYGKDRERMNMEVMQLYKTHKVNPLGGCLPMLVQIPFFFALYKILLGSIELRHAPFFLWITDLSDKDPYYITPIVMGASMLLQQKLTPMTGTNPTQMKMMMYGLPAVFTFMFLNFPSGLVIYWLVNNLLSIAQQAWMLRRAEPAAA
ncbi:MAG: membrane protein insertase YidC [Deferrisomatales bacterium]|nr:membrane protein insertase YidC [Deferrisomatales bacterium]